MYTLQHSALPMLIAEECGKNVPVTVFLIVVPDTPWIPFSPRNVYAGFQAMYKFLLGPTNNSSIVEWET